MAEFSKIKVLFFKGSGFVGWAIRFRTWGDYAHVALDIDGQIYESIEGKGVISYPAKDLKRQPDLVLEPEGPKRFKHNIARLARMFCNRELGKPYDYRAIYGFLVRKKRQQDEKWFCSEFAAEAFKYAEFPLLERVESYKLSPSDLAKSPRLSPPDKRKSD